MLEQKYRVGDRVCIRPFAEIDTADIGDLDYNRGNEYNRPSCYGISKGYIDARSAESTPLYVVKVEQRRDTYIYDLCKERPGGDRANYHWAQGMIMPFYEEDVFIPTDKDEIFENIVLYGLHNYGTIFRVWHNIHSYRILIWKK